MQTIHKLVVAVLYAQSGITSRGIVQGEGEKREIKTAPNNRYQ